MTDYPDDLRELYLEYGRAAEMAQLMELEAGNLALAYVTMLIDPATITDEERGVLRALVRDVNRRTFGNLFRQIQAMGLIDDGIVAALNTALEKRNYLTHSFFRRYNFAIHSEEGRKPMIAEIRSIQATLGLAHSILHGMTGSLSQVLSEIVGRSPMSTQTALDLMKVGKRVDVL